MTGDHLAATLSRMDATQAKDKVGKRMFRHRRLVADMLVHYVPGRWVRRIDVGTLRPMPTEYVNRSGDRRFGDALWLSQLHDGRQVMLIVELQSSGDPNMAARMAAYAGMVYESLTADAKGPDGRYPGLLPLVVYTGGDAWGAADSLRALVDRIDGLAHHVAARCYRRIDLCRLAEHDARQTNRLDFLVRLTASASLSHTVAILKAAATWFRDGGEDEEDRSLFRSYQVPCPASFWCFRVRHARQCKAWSAGNIGHIGKGHNAAVARMANSRRARPTGPVAALRPLAMGPPFPAGTRLATDPVGRAEIPETCGTRH